MTTSVTAANIATLRRLVDEPLTTTYSDALLTTIIENRPLVDQLGTDPYYWDTTTSPPTQVTTTGWIPTYDLNLAAADIWQEKAAALANTFNFSADGGNNSYSDKFEHCKKMTAYYLSRRSAGSIPVHPV